ncbi:phytanoyl-CoA dioxygenase family protein [uncultured Roseobacter sp.]|uniref:phytanoyl-CoA dioxygenase family protein n=1 Tax=uncultured Roseobacter sp. TaxID=114847 RepID=UPI0026045ADE|nr:phytanoyl-CoA dioxygenase family protein [uncultured Roseobacter sp.]
MPQPLPLANGRLSAAQSDQYRADGYLFPLPVMPAHDAQALRAELEALEAEWLDSDLPLPFGTYKRVNAHCVMPLAWRIGHDRRILDVVEGVLGPDIMVYSVEFFIKEPNTRHIVSMHQDLTYWGLGEIDGLVTAWLALSPATPASGCMDFVRGSHKNPILPHDDTFSEDNLLSRGQEVRVDVAEADKVPIEIHPGQISLHHGLMIHGSGPNTTDDRRIAAVVRYCTPAIKQQVGARDYAVLARGQDRFGHFEGFEAPQAPFTPTALATYDEIRRAQAATMMRGAEKEGGLYA